MLSALAGSYALVMPVEARQGSQVLRPASRLLGADDVLQVRDADLDVFYNHAMSTRGQRRVTLLEARRLKRDVELAVATDELPCRGAA